MFSLVSRKFLAMRNIVLYSVSVKRIRNLWLEGCGRSKGLRLVVDSQKLAYKSKKVHKQISTGKEV